MKATLKKEPISGMEPKVSIHQSSIPDHHFFKGICTVILLMIFNLPFHTIQAQWNTNTAVNIQISSLVTADMQTVSTTDGKTWVAFYNNTSGNYDMRAQLIDAEGYKLLGPDGILVSNQPSGSATYVFNVCVDASNNLIIGNQDQRNGTMQAVLYKISQSGAHLWGSSGVILGDGLAPYPAVLSNGETVVAWNGNTTINIQKISAAGTTVWTTPVSVVVGTSNTTRGQIVPNTNGKFTMVYQKKGYGISTTLYAQQFDNSGTALYSPLQICSQTSSGSRYYSIVADADTTYFGYYVSSSSRFNSFLQRINPGGTIPWGMNGSNFSTYTGSGDSYQGVTNINMASGSNYLWSVCTFCNPSQTQYGVYIQKFLKTSGVRQFTDAAKVVYPISASSDQQRGTLAIVNDTPMFMSYDNSYKIYATRLDANGNFLWTGNRVELSSTTASASDPKGRFGFTPDGPNRCAGIWTEDRGSGELGYAQGVSIGGLIGINVATQGNVPATITTGGGTLQMVDTIFPLTAIQNATWSIVQGTGMASISSTGLVTAITNGTVWAKAVAVQDVTVKDSLLITISGQAPGAPFVITNPATNVGLNSGTLNGSVMANGSNSTVTFQWGLTTAYGNTVSATPSLVTGYSYTAVLATMTSLTPNTTYHFRCVATNSIGTTNGLDQSFVTVCPTVGPAGPISGPGTICTNATGLVYTIGSIANATGYVWTVPSGATIISGQNTTSITVNFGSNSGNVSVYGTNGCNNGLVNNYLVTVNPAPVPTITGANNPCQNSGNIMYTTESGMSNYNWTVSSGGSIISGNGTYQIQVAWNSTGNQYVTVSYTTVIGCPTITPTNYPVSVITVPDPAGNITGPSHVCAGSTGITYSIAPVANANAYIWTLPAGATISSGNNTNIITVDFAVNASSGDITVLANNLCGNGASSSLAVTIDPLPNAAGTITGQDSVCQSAAGVSYSVPAITGATAYVWTVPSGATITSGSTTNQILVNFSVTAVSGVITVKGTNTCGSGTVSPDFAVTVSSIPPAPVVTVNGFELTSSAPAGNQWYYNGVAIPGATAQTYTVTHNTGYYWCIVTLNGCSSEISNKEWIEVVGIIEIPESASFNVYPVPNDGRFSASIQYPVETTFTITVYNQIGSKIFELRDVKTTGGQYQKTIDLRPVPTGIYSVVFLNSEFKIIRKVLVNK
ncbi:MAG: T9SS type A sorting domain-containing protein [Bacteroidales bacterium]|nr:T9SS type A sorting domain-containing protein [Bacteroidales bacterium]